MTAPGGAAPSKGNPHYEFMGVTRYWRFSEENIVNMSDLVNLATDVLYTPVKQYIQSKSAYFDQVL